MADLDLDLAEEAAHAWDRTCPALVLALVAVPARMDPGPPVLMRNLHLARVEAERDRLKATAEAVA